MTNLIHDVLNLRHQMNLKLEQDYERKIHNKKVERKYKLAREGGHTRLYDEHHEKHIRKTEKLKEAVRLLRGQVV